MSNLVTRTVELIYQMDNSQINQVIEAIKLKRTHLARQATRALIVGDTVQFRGRNNRIVQGRVVKVNQKTVSVDAGIEGRWKVTASMLQKVEA
jgi:putative ribosome biogenesis GTPase RsgA